MADLRTETNGGKPRIGAAPRQNGSERLLTPKEAANLLRLSTSWLAKARMRGDGPAYEAWSFYSVSGERFTRLDEISSANVNE